MPVAGVQGSWFPPPPTSLQSTHRNKRHTSHIFLLSFFFSFSRAAPNNKPLTPQNNTKHVHHGEGEVAHFFFFSASKTVLIHLTQQAWRRRRRPRQFTQGPPFAASQSRYSWKLLCPLPARFPSLSLFSSLKGVPLLRLLPRLVLPSAKLTFSAAIHPPCHKHYRDHPQERC